VFVFHTENRASARIHDYFADPAGPRKNLDLIDEPSVLAFEFNFQDFAGNRSQRQGQYLGQRQRFAMLVSLPRVVMITAATSPSSPPRGRLRRRKRGRHDGKNKEAAIRAHGRPYSLRARS
jgi:hypothetical protein